MAQFVIASSSAVVVMADARPRARCLISLKRHVFVPSLLAAPVVSELLLPPAPCLSVCLSGFFLPHSQPSQSLVARRLDLSLSHSAPAPL